MAIGRKETDQYNNNHSLVTLEDCWHMSQHSTIASDCLRDASLTLHGIVVPVVHVAGG